MSQRGRTREIGDSLFVIYEADGTTVLEWNPAVHTQRFRINLLRKSDGDRPSFLEKQEEKWET